MLSIGCRPWKDAAGTVLENIMGDNCLNEIITRLCVVVVSEGRVANHHIANVEDL